MLILDILDFCLNGPAVYFLNLIIFEININSQMAIILKIIETIMIKFLQIIFYVKNATKTKYDKKE